MAAWVIVLASAACSGVLAWNLSRRRLAVARAASATLAGLVIAGVVLLADDIQMRKILGHLGMPFGLMWLALGFLWIHLLATGTRRPGLVALAIWIVYTAGANTWVANVLYGALEDSVETVRLEDAPAFDAVFVLGGGAVLRPEGTPELTEWGDRVLLAARLYHANKAPVLITSGAGLPAETNDLTRATEQLWIELGVPPSAIRRYPVPRTTREEVAVYAELIAREHWKRVALVSSAWHLPRAMEHVRARGLEMTPIATNRRWASPPSYHPIMLIPRPDVFATTQLVCWELVGRALGR